MQSLYCNAVLALFDVSGLLRMAIGLRPLWLLAIGYSSFIGSVFGLAAISISAVLGHFFESCEILVGVCIL